MDAGFHRVQGSGMNQQAICFQSSPRESKSEMIVMGDLHRMSSTGSLSFSGNSGDSLVIDSVPDLKNRTGLAVEWSVEEQYKLEEALPKYADEPGIIRYVKIAATLRNKTVRDVALRCRWMGPLVSYHELQNYTWLCVIKRKRRKHEELNLWKKTKDKKDKVMESSLKSSVHSTINVAPFSLSMNPRPWGDGIHVEALRGSIRHLLEQNSRALSQISTNISALRLQDNVDLFSQMKNNITAILNDMRCIPGPPLPVTLNDDLVNSIVSIKSQSTTMFASSGGMNMKQETGCW